MRLLVLLALALAAGAPQAQNGDRLAIGADTVYTAAGEPIENGLVVMGGGKIVAVLPGPGDTEPLLRVAAITPGLIDLGGWMNGGSISVEEATETPAHLRAAEALDLFSHLSLIHI